MKMSSTGVNDSVIRGPNKVCIWYVVLRSEIRYIVIPLRMGRAHRNLDLACGHFCTARHPHF